MGVPATGEPPMTHRYFEDYRVGDTISSAGVTLTEASIIDFATTYDPQPFHIDVVAAEESQFGGLIASGWQVIALSFRLLVDAGFLKGTGMGSPGLDELKWLRPVRPGDTIRCEATVISAKPSAKRDDRGYVTLDFSVFNQHGEVVATYRCPEIIRRRPPASAPD
jgi:acyl dehydratase